MSTRTSILLAIAATVFYVAHLFSPLDSLVFISHNECLNPTVWGKICVGFCWFLLVVMWPSFVYAISKSIKSKESYFGIPNWPIFSLAASIFQTGLFFFLFSADLFEVQSCPEAQLTIYGYVYTASLAIVFAISCVFGTAAFLNIVSRLLGKK